MKFFADAMLGRLARWMRIMGYDVAYERKIGDREIVERAGSEGRLILTRDTLLIRMRKAKGNVFLVEGDSYKDQLKQVVHAFRTVDTDDLLSRCIECNTLLAEVNKEDVITLVPEFVYKTQENFSVCPTCRRIYWSATHKDKIVKTLQEIFDI